MEKIATTPIQYSPSPQNTLSLQFWSHDSPDHTAPYISRRLVIIITVIIILLDLPLNGYSREALYFQGLNTIFQMQNPPIPFLALMSNLVSLAVDPVVITVVLCFLFLTASNKFSLLLILIFFLINTYLMGEFKAYYTDPRPYWTDFNIKILSWYCPIEYGNPSGHSWLAPPLYQLLIYEYFGSGKYGLHMLIPATLSVLVPLSRMYLGVHSANQIMQGLLNGLALLVLYRYLLKEELGKLLSRFMKKNLSLSVLLGTVFVHLLCITVPVIIYQLNSSVGLSVDEITNILQNCGTSQKSLDSLNSGLLMMGALINLAFGFTYGLYSVRESYTYYFGKWTYTNKYQLWTSRALKIGMDIVLIGLPVVVMGFIGLVANAGQVGQYLLVCLGLAAGGYLLIGHSARILSQLQIIKLIETEVGECHNLLINST